MDDCLVIGAGVIGLSIAYELSGHGLRVRVIDRQRPAAEASWAGAGILPPPPATPQTPLEQLAALSVRLHSEWARQLRNETGIDNEYRRCGAWYLRMQDVSEPVAVTGPEMTRRADYVNGHPMVQSVKLREVAESEPALAVVCSEKAILAAGLANDEAQLRNPRHLQALLSACECRGVKVESDVEVTGFWVSAGQVVGAQTSSGPKYAGTFCVTSGAWTGQLTEMVGISIPLVPIRGQMVLLRNPQPGLRRIVNVGKRYLVPRLDGRVLVGSTEENVGYEKCNTDEGIAGLLDFAGTLVPHWRTAEVERTWAGLRPATSDEMPYLGRAPALDNLFVAAGHFRSGIYLSPATAVVMSELIRGLPPSIDLSAFRIDRDVPPTLASP
ncbi:MAG: glycine oxidase ThiO [Pirellulales bacterium]